MFRRCVITFVLFGFIAGQLAAIPHAHGGHSPAEQSEHDARPHFHFGKSAHSRDHGHSHGHHSHQHYAADEQSLDRRLSDENDLGLEHDANAVYLIAGSSSNVLVKVRRGATVADCIVLSNAALPALSCPSAFSGGSSLFRPPDEVSGGPKLFLTLRNLRI
jgi:hypothetical protein